MPKKFTWKELSELKYKHNAHVAYERKVYDVSSFVAHHPGGVEQIMSGAGTDITQVFKSYHATNTFQRVLSKYYVGELIDNELPVFPNESIFFDVVKERISNYLKAKNLDPKIHSERFITYIALLLSYFLAFTCCIIFHQYLLICVALTVLRAHLTTIIGGTLYHDSSHFSITHKPWVWKTINILSAPLLGISPYVWRYRHIMGHHPFTNIEGVDPDIDTGPEDQSTFFKIRNSQRWFKHYMYQQFYMPLLYFVQTTVMQFTEFIAVWSLNINGIRMNPLNLFVWIEFCVAKVGHIMLTFIIPLWFMPLPNAVLYGVVFELAFGVSFTQLTQLNHVTNEVLFTRPDESSKKVTTDWAELQVEATQDYCTGSWFWSLFTAGLNHQTAHHLFPGFLPSHYRWITPIIKQTCAEMNVRYNSSDSIIETLRLHYKFLRKMGLNKRE